MSEGQGPELSGRSMSKIKRHFQIEAMWTEDSFRKMIAIGLGINADIADSMAMVTAARRRVRNSQ